MKRLVQRKAIWGQFKGTYFVNSKTKSVMKIEVETIDKSRINGFIKYYLDNNQRPMIVSADKIDGKVFRHANTIFKRQACV